jgi:hypothetical protein
MRKISKAKKALFIIILGIIVLAGLYIWVADYTYQANRQITYGVTFSKEYAQYLGLDWKTAYIATLDDLKARYIRLPVYWDQLEAEKDLYNFENIDWQVSEASKRDARLILVLGRRQPRWPECHDPAWVEGAPTAEVKSKILKNIKLVVDRYKANTAVEIWQVENEPFLDFFGECPKLSKADLQEEINLVKKLDDRKVLLTDSGELSTWYPLIKMGDMFGTTMYRTTYNKYFGYWNYFFLPASYYRVKAYLWGKPMDATIVAELQAEPWFPEAPGITPLEDQLEIMNADKLKANAEYANQTNFYRAYFWGVEWWYWLKVKNNNSSLWDTAKQYFK